MRAVSYLWDLADDPSLDHEVLADPLSWWPSGEYLTAEEALLELLESKDYESVLHIRYDNGQMCSFRRIEGRAS